MCACSRADGLDQSEAELLYEIGETARSGGDILEAEEHLHKALEASHKLADPLVRTPNSLIQGQGRVAN
jgi:hypothetical protein